MDIASSLLPSSDLLASLEDSTDITCWINNLLDADNKTTVSDLATRLEVTCQDTSTQLEQSIDDISRTVPRLTYDLHFLRESTLSLKLALSSLQTRLSASLADHETTQALERLSYLDTVKTRMEASHSVLREAESWSTLESEVTSLLADLQHEKAAERLADASKSMIVFQNTTEYESRRALMVSLQNQLEASLSSALVAAINSRDIALCKNYYSVFSNIQRESEFRNYYNGSRRTTLLQLWTSASLLDIEGESPHDTAVKFCDFLTHFFADFLALINEERAFTPAIFPDPQQTISTFVQSTIDALTPSLSQRLSGLSEHYGASALPQLINAFRAAEDFAVATDKIIEKVAYTALFSPTPPDDTSKTHSRRLSKRMSMSRRLGPARSVSGNIFTPSGGAWEQALFEPFVDLQAEYEVLEKKFLDQGLQSLRNPVSVDGARLFRERSVHVFSMAEESLGRCMDFTHGYGAVGLLRSLDATFTAFLERSRAELLSRGDASPTNIPGDTFEELDYTTQDWGTIQLALHLLEACRVVREQLSVLELKVRAGLVQVASAFRLSRADAQGLYIANTTRGETILLNQSTLNSAELHQLLNRLDGGTSDSQSPLVLLGGARDAVTDFTRSCQKILQETLLSPLIQHLSTYASFPGWTADTTSGSTRTSDTRDLHIPTFSLSPTPTIQRVAEGLLNLPRLFEVYADDDALAFSIETLPFVDAESLRAVLTPSPSESPDPHHHLRRLSSSQSQLHTINSAPKSNPHASSPLPPELIVSAWLSSLTLSLLTHLTSQTFPSLPWRTLSRPGAVQLQSDLEYLANIVRAVGVELGEAAKGKEKERGYLDLEKWREAVGMGEEEWRNFVRNNGEEGEGVLEAVARLRGWTV